MDEEKQPGPSRARTDETQKQTPASDADEDFLRMQETDPTLAFARDNVVIEDGQTLDD